MKILIVYAHPNPDSYNAALFKMACETLSNKGHQVHAIDLYNEGFEAAMSCEEQLRYMTADNTQGLENHVAKLRWAESLILIYPTWWMGPPAILKGWLDRTWLPGIAATFGADGVKPGLTNLKKIWVITTQNSSWWRMALIGNPPRKMLRFSMRSVTECKEFKWLALYRIDKTTDPERVRFLETVKKKLQQF